MKDLPCPACGGDEAKAADCPACQGEGCELLTRCPFDDVPAAVWECLELCEFADKGNLPVSGGVHDQTRSFLQSLRIVRADKAYFRNLANKPNPRHG